MLQRNSNNAAEHLRQQELELQENASARINAHLQSHLAEAEQALDKQRRSHFAKAEQEIQKALDKQKGSHLAEAQQECRSTTRIRKIKGHIEQKQNKNYRKLKIV